MKLKVLLCCLFVVGFGASYALAGNGHGNGANKKDPTTSSSSTTTTTASKKTLVCHKTHSKKKQYVLININSHAVASHLRHGDVLATNGTCPSASTTTTAATTTSRR